MQSCGNFDFPYKNRDLLCNAMPTPLQTNSKKFIRSSSTTGWLLSLDFYFNKSATTTKKHRNLEVTYRKVRKCAVEPNDVSKVNG